MSWGAEVGLFHRRTLRHKTPRLFGTAPGGFRIRRTFPKRPFFRPIPVVFMRLRSAVPVLLFIAACWLTGCSGGNKISAAEPKEAYDLGVEQYQKKKYLKAIEYFRLALNFGRTHEWADDTQIALARAYFGNREYLLAANEYTRFLELYQGDPRQEAAAFERAHSYYQLSPPYRLDQTDTETALSYLRQFASQYPDSEHTERVAEMMDELRDKLARKKFEASEQYEVMGRFEAAALSYLDVMEQYPSTRYVEPALIGAIRSYIAYADASIQARQAERYRRAVEVYQQFTQLFPNSRRRSEAQRLYEEATRKLGAIGATIGP